MIGLIWSQPAFIVLARPVHHSYTRLEQVSEFTVNVPPVELAAVREEFYGIDDFYPVYFGETVAAYALEDAAQRLRPKTANPLVDLGLSGVAMFQGWSGPLESQQLTSRKHLG